MQIAIIGGGPTGIGAGHRLLELGSTSWVMYERNNFLGGLAASYHDSHGFIWDTGGHVLFSHYPYIDKLLEKLLGDDYLSHERESWIRVLETWVPYPFQNNLQYLPKEVIWECVKGLLDVQDSMTTNRSAHFLEWINNTFGTGIAKYFMHPYNFKVWATPLEMMDHKWISDRISIIELERTLKNIILKQDDTSWGPNNKFKFPLKGGTGALFNKYIDKFKHNLHFKKEVTKIYYEEKTLAFSDGTSANYDRLINTAPLDQLISWLTPSVFHLEEAAKKLLHSGVMVTGIGLARANPSKKCWMYFPENNSPFYRVTNFSNYSPYNVPNGDIKNYSSYMCEVSYSQFKPVNKKTIIQNTINGLINTGLLSEKDRSQIISIFTLDLPYGYPTPTIERDDALKTILPGLEHHQIYSRGRFGLWKYEVGNIDHSMIMGVEIVNRLILGNPETVAG